MDSGWGGQPQTFFIIKEKFTNKQYHTLTKSNVTNNNFILLLRNEYTSHWCCSQDTGVKPLPTY